MRLREGQGPMGQLKEREEEEERARNEERRYRGGNKKREICKERGEEKGIEGEE